MTIKPSLFRFVVTCLGVVAAAAFAVASDRDRPSSGPADEKALWELEHAYWKYVEANDMAKYMDLWHPDFLGWPSVSPAPLRKAHITDWITSQTNKGLAFKAGEFKPGDIQVTGDVAFVGFWITYRWADKDGAGDPVTVRITHAWLKVGKKWQIIGGMSMPEPSE